MMKVAFDISPTVAGHSVRGIGSYTQNLKKALSNIKTNFDIDYVESVQNTLSYDLIHYPYFDLFFHTLPIKKTQKKRIVTIHDVIPLLFPDKFPSGIRGFINLFLQKLALKNVDFVICDSQTSKRDISDKLSVPPSKIKTIYLAAGEEFKKEKNINFLNKTAKKYKLPKKFCLYVGDVNWNKNILNLLAAVKISKIPIVMVGSALTNNSLWEVDQIETQIKKLGMASLVIKTGYVPTGDLPSIYSLSSVTVQPSYYEGFGLPVLESLSCGTPVVCSNNSSLSEITGTATVFCDPSNPKDIAEKISSVVNLNASAKESLSEKSLHQASKFSWQKTAQQTLDLYKKVLNS